MAARSNALCFDNLYKWSLTPVLPIICHGRTRPLSHFWHHHLWPKLELIILNFCRRERSVQWYPDQSDRLNGAWDMLENAQKFEWKTQSKIFQNYTWLLHGKNCLSQWCFVTNKFELETSPVEGQSLQQKKEEKKERWRNKNKTKCQKT